MLAGELLKSVKNRSSQYEDVVSDYNLDGSDLDSSDRRPNRAAKINKT
jgi:hypothetical protein